MELNWTAVPFNCDTCLKHGSNMRHSLIVLMLMHIQSMYPVLVVVKLISRFNVDECYILYKLIVNKG